jgi:DNA-binding MarR family transcriptional regulator
VVVSEETRQQLLLAVMRSLGRTSAQHAAFSQALAAQLGIAPTDLECLALLQDLGATSAGQLAESLSLTTGAITGVVDRLESNGFVVREADPSDRRRVIVRPVAERMSELDRAHEPLVRASAYSLSGYAESDLRLLLDFQRRASQLLQRETARLKAERLPSEAGAEFTAPLGLVTAGCLEFSNGASELRVFANEHSAQLYHAVFEGPQPTVRVQDGHVIFRYKRMNLFDWGKHAGTVGLNPKIDWGIALRGGASSLVIDARGLQVRELTIEGGASKLDILLSAPTGTVPVRIDGGLNRVRIERPTRVPAQVLVHGGANRLEFDGQRFGAVGGDVRLATPGWELATDRYALEIRGGASRLEVHRI